MVTRLPLGMLDRKLLRDLWHLRGQLASIGVVVACGVATVVTTRTSYTSLLESRAAYYANQRFADVFVTLKRAPESVAGRLAAIPGVQEVGTRVVVPVTLDVPGLPEPATGRIVSVPEHRTPMLNDLHLRQGRWIEPGRRDEVIASEAFATANRLALGAALGAVINGRWQRLRVVGIAITPEYVYEISPGGLFPDNRRFGVLWMSRAAVAGAFDLDGAFNDAALLLAPGASEADVIAQVDALLASFGGTGAYGRRDHVSARFIEDEIGQNRVSGTVIPAIFLGVAAFLLHVVLGRLVNTQREQIAVLKAFGYSDRAVGWHYVKLALAALLVGAIVGSAAGLWLARGVNERYAQYYRFPTFLFRPDGTALAIALLTTVAAALTGAAGAVRRVVRLPPAAAMQEEPPTRFARGPLERLGVAGRLGIASRMIARSLERRPTRALVSIVGLSLAVALLITGRFFVDAINFLGDVQFRHVQREDISVAFASLRPPDVRHALARLPGVQRAEVLRAAPVRIVAGHRSRRIAVMGLDRRGQLRDIVGTALVPRALPPEGVILTAKLAEVLAVGTGDTVRMVSLEGRRDTIEVPVVGTVDELMGLSAYMDGGALARAFGDEGIASGALLKVDPAQSAALFERLKHLPAVAAVASREASLASFEATLAQSIGIMTAVLIGFAGALAGAVVYNAARITLSERGRELASLRVLGFTRGEVASMLLGEQGLVAAAGIVAGLPLGFVICAVLSGLYQWELYRIPLIVSNGTYAFAVTVVIGAALGSAWLVRRRLDRLDLVAVLKSRE